MQKSLSENKRYPAISEWLLPGVKFAQCPIKTSLGVLGKKWAMLVLRDVALLGVDRFNRLPNSIPGLTPGLLSMRLKELEKEGSIKCVENGKSPMIARWMLTEKGREMLYQSCYNLPFLAQSGTLMWCLRTRLLDGLMNCSSQRL